MIIGIGSDIIDIRRIEKSLERFGARFENRIFTANEQTYAKQKAGAGLKIVASAYAKRFAAKEACAKALGAGLRQGVLWRDMEVANLASGKPVLTLAGGAQRHLQAMLPQGKTAAIHLTLADDYPMAQAFVIIEAL